MNKLLEILSKLGILRYGAAAGTYRNAAEAPDDFMDIYTNKNDNAKEVNGDTAMFCPQCGNELPDDAKFCSGCGTGITQSANATTQQTQPQVASQQVAAKPKKKSKIGRILMWVGIFIVAVIGLALFATSGMVDVVDNHLAALRAGDVSVAYEHTSKAFRKATPLPVYKKFIAKYPILVKHEEFSAGNREFEDNTGSVDGTLTSSQHGTASIKFIMVKEEENWRIQGFNIE